MVFLAVALEGMVGVTVDGGSRLGSIDPMPIEFQPYANRF